MTLSPYAIGLDLGQAQDFSALAVVEHVDVVPPGWAAFRYFDKDPDTGMHLPFARPGVPPMTRELRVVHLQRWQLGTPYHQIVEDVAVLARSHELNGARFYFDRSGVGRPVGDLLWEAYMRGHLGDTMPEGRTITGAERSSRAGTAKKDLIAALEIPIQQGNFKIPAGLPLADVLERELTSFKLKLAPKTGREKFDIERRAGEGHGDLVIAVALAAVHPDYGIQPRLAATDSEGDPS